MPKLKLPLGQRTDNQLLKRRDELRRMIANKSDIVIENVTSHEYKNVPMRRIVANRIDEKGKVGNAARRIADLADEMQPIQFELNRRNIR